MHTTDHALAGEHPGLFHQLNAFEQQMLVKLSMGTLYSSLIPDHAIIDLFMSIHVAQYDFLATSGAFVSKHALSEPRSYFYCCAYYPVSNPSDLVVIGTRHGRFGGIPSSEALARQPTLILQFGHMTDCQLASLCCQVDYSVLWFQCWSRSPATVYV